MKKRKLIFPAISIGLLIATRPASADVVDFGVVAESLSVNSALTYGSTIGGFTFTGLTFVGSNLNDVINGLTVSSILEQVLGPENPGSGSFNLPAVQGGAQGAFAFNGNLTISNGQNTFTGLPYASTLTSCSPEGSAAPLPGCTAGNTFTANPYDPAGIISSMEAAQIVDLPSGITNGGTLTSSLTITIPLGISGNTSYQGEEIESVTGVPASTVPEPPSWSLFAMGTAVLTWCRRRFKTERKRT